MSTSYIDRIMPDNLDEFSNATCLEISKVDRLSPDLTKLEKLQELRIFKSDIKRLPEDIDKLKNLKELVIVDTKIKKLPERLSNMGIELLSIEHNNFKKFPMQITKLKELKKLIIINEKIKQIPPEISSLTKLKSLMLIGLPIKIVPEIKSDNLRYLSVDRSKLTKFPEWIAQKKELEHITMSDNKIKILPIEIAKLEKLNTLEIDETRIRYVPQEISALLMGNNKKLVIASSDPDVMRNIALPRIEKDIIINEKHAIEYTYLYFEKVVEQSAEIKKEVIKMFADKVNNNELREAVFMIPLIYGLRQALSNNDINMLKSFVYEQIHTDLNINRQKFKYLIKKGFNKLGEIML